MSAPCTAQMPPQPVAEFQGLGREHEQHEAGKDMLKRENANAWYVDYRDISPCCSA